jgi:SAM-dependent methyltransferase
MHFLEPILQQLRINKVLPFIENYLKKHKKIVLVDLGCNTTFPFLKQIAPRVEKAVGLDMEIKQKSTKNILLKKADLNLFPFPLKKKYADIVTMLAVLEHLDFPDQVLKEASRILKPKGLFLATVPAPQSQSLLEFLARLKLVNPKMIEQHRNYFSPLELQKLLQKAGFKKGLVKTWQFGFNTFVIAKK